MTAYRQVLALIGAVMFMTGSAYAQVQSQDQSQDQAQDQAQDHSRAGQGESDPRGQAGSDADQGDPETTPPQSGQRQELSSEEDLDAFFDEAQRQAGEGASCAPPPVPIV